MRAGARTSRDTAIFSDECTANASIGGARRGQRKVRWVFQTVHRDLWDDDVPAQPSLVDLTIDGQNVPALVQPTKQGEVFVLDRAT